MARKKTTLITDFNNIPDEALVPEDEQPYPIPDHWKWVKFAFLNSFVSKTFDPTDYRDQSVTLYSVPSFPVGFPETVQGKEIGSTKQFVQSGDVLLCKINPRINRVWVVTQAAPVCVASSEWIVFRPSFGIPEYYAEYFRSAEFRSLLTSKVSGVGGSLTRARPKDVDGYPVPLPPLDEQRAIVDALESHTNKIDQAINLASNFLAGIDAQRNQIIKSGVDGELTAQWRSLRKLLRENWELRTLGVLGAWGGGGTPSKSKPEFWEQGDIRWITPKDMKAPVITDSQMRITQLGSKNSSAHCYQGPAVLFVTRSGILRRLLPVALADGEFAVNQDLKVLHSFEGGINAQYVALFAQAYEATIRAECAKSGTTVESIDFDKLKGFPLSLPTIEEQEEIVRVIGESMTELERSGKLCRQSLEKLIGVHESLVAAAFRGKIDTAATDNYVVTNYQSAY